MLPPGLRTPREVTLFYDARYQSLIESGQAYPFLYPWAGIGAFVVLGYLLIDHRSSPFLKWLRFPLYALLLAFQSWCIWTTRAKNPAAAFGVGLISSWGSLWVGAIMVFNDCQSDFARVERVRALDGKHGMNGDISNGSITSAEVSDADRSDPATKKADQPRSQPEGTLYWQPFPATLADRMDWVADVFCSFRGVGWNWQSSAIPALPKHVQSLLHGSVDASSNESMTISRSGIRRFSDRKALVRETLLNAVIGYLALDIIATMMRNDMYFAGYMDAPPPSYLPNFVLESHVWTKSYRLVLSLSGIYAALWEIFKCGPLFFCGVLGPRWIGVRGEAWMNPPDMFGTFRLVLDQGLAGWWGGWWHQTFRHSFEVPAKRLQDALGIDQKSSAGKFTSLTVAFVLSGCLHASGSYTQLGDTRPLMGPMRFFLLQPIGILLQRFLTSQLSGVAAVKAAPRWSKQFTNFAYVHIWLYFTAPLLVDDFAKGGVWLFEPVAISPLRGGLRLGNEDDGWWCWWNGLLFWQTGKHWWDTGIAL